MFGDQWSQELGVTFALIEAVILAIPSVSVTQHPPFIRSVSQSDITTSYVRLEVLIPISSTFPFKQRLVPSTTTPRVLPLRLMMALPAASTSTTHIEEDAWHVSKRNEPMNSTTKNATVRVRPRNRVN